MKFGAAQFGHVNDDALFRCTLDITATVPKNIQLLISVRRIQYGMKRRNWTKCQSHIPTKRRTGNFSFMTQTPSWTFMPRNVAIVTSKHCSATL